MGYLLDVAYCNMAEIEKMAFDCSISVRDRTLLRANVGKSRQLYVSRDVALEFSLGPSSLVLCCIGLSFLAVVHVWMSGSFVV